MFSEFDPVTQTKANCAACPTAVIMRRAESIVLFLFGGLGYGLLEILWRGRTHWSMLLCGGFALLLLRQIGRFSLPFWAQCAAGAACITGLELAVGLVLNRWLRLGVWDYSSLWGNLWGQICPAFSLLWLLLSAAMLAVLRTLPPWQDSVPLPAPDEESAAE